MGETNGQFEAKSIILTQELIKIIDAIPIEATQSGLGEGNDDQPKRDIQADQHVNKDSRLNFKFTYGYSVHTRVDENSFF